jgi:hypothetical protein
MQCRRVYIKANGPRKEKFLLYGEIVTLASAFESGFLKRMTGLKGFTGIP